MSSMNRRKGEHSLTNAAQFTPVQALIAREIEYWNDGDVLAWASDYAQKNDVWNSIAFTDLVSLNAKRSQEVEKAHSLLARFVTEKDPTFSIRTRASEHQARLFLLDRLSCYIEEKCRPYDLCKMAVAIENTFDFPDWLGDLWNACDWIEPETRPSDCRHLEAYARELSDALIRG